MPKHALEFLSPDLLNILITQNNGAELLYLIGKV